MKHKQTKVKWNQSLRFGTISHILASTDLNCCTKKEDVLSDEALIEKNAVEIVKQMQRLKGIDGDYDSDSAASNRLAQRHTIQVDKDLIFPICAQQHICSVSSEQPFFFSYLNWNLPRTSSVIDKRKEQLEPLMLPSRNDSLLSQVLLNLNLNVVSTIRSWMLTWTLSNFQERRTRLEAKLTEHQSLTISIVRKLGSKSN